MEDRIREDRIGHEIARYQAKRDAVEGLLNVKKKELRQGVEVAELNGIIRYLERIEHTLSSYDLVIKVLKSCIE